MLASQSRNIPIISRSCNLSRPAIKARTKATAINAGSQSIREFIALECPVAGFDGRYRERPKEVSMELQVIQGGLVTPGCRSLMKVSQTQLDQVVQDKGQVILCVMQEADSSLPLQPPKGGSYACLAQVYGLQRLPNDQGGYIRLVAQQRVAVQAVKAHSAPALTRAQAAVLDDRWAYFVKSMVVQDVLEAAIKATGSEFPTQESLNMSGQPADIRSSVASMQDVAQQLQGELLQIQDLLLTQKKRQPDSDQVEEILDEVASVIDFIQGPAGKADVHSFAALQRLSFAVLALEYLASYTGLAFSDLSKYRHKAMEATDLGLRLEQSLDFVEKLSGRLSALMAVDAAI